MLSSQSASMVLTKLNEDPRLMFPITVEELSSKLTFDVMTVDGEHTSMDLPYFTAEGSGVDGLAEEILWQSFQTAVCAAYDRNLIVYDADAPAQTFTDRLVSLVKVVLRRNSQTLGKVNTQTIFCDDQAWDDFVDSKQGPGEADKMRESCEFPSVNVFGVAIRPLSFLNPNIAPNRNLLNYYEEDLGGTYAGGDSRLAIAFGEPKFNSRAMAVWPLSYRYLSGKHTVNVGIGVFNSTSLCLATY